MRISKFLASLGYGARRKIDQLIEQKKIIINKTEASLGQQLEIGDKIFLNGQWLITYQGQKEKNVKIYAYHKPINTLCAHQDKSDKTLIYDNLDLDTKEQWMTVGRLDFKTTGLILITNCGDTAQKLTHPSNKIKREYEVKISPKLTSQDQLAIENGLLLDDGLAQVSKCTIMKFTQSGSWVRLSLYEGKNREIRRIFEKLKYRVLKLKRISYGPITLNGIEKAGQIKEVNQEIFEKR